MPLLREVNSLKHFYRKSTSCTNIIFQISIRYHLETASKGDCYFDFYLNKVPVDGKCYNGFAKSFPRGDGITKVEACFYKSFEADEMYVTMIRSDDWSALKKHFFDIPRRILQISIPINIKYDALSDTLTVSKPQ